MIPSKEHIEKLPFFFILGRPRSGSTLLATIIDAHPNAILPFESAVIVNLYPKYGHITQWSKTMIEAFYDDLLLNRKFSIWPVDNQQLRDNLLKLEGDCTFETMIKAVYLHFKSFFEKSEISIIGDKNPVYCFYGKKILDIFPDAKVIHLARDYRDQILSVRKVNFEASVTSLLAFRWKYAQKKIFQLSVPLGDRYLYLRYEDLVANPDEKVKEIFGFLGLAYDPSVLQFYNKKQKVLEQFTEQEINQFHSSLFHPINNSKVGIWKNQMPEKDILLADHIVGRTAEESNYERRYTHTQLIRYLTAVFWLLYGRFSLWVRFATDNLPYRMKMRIRKKGPWMAFLFHKLFSPK